MKPAEPMSGFVVQFPLGVLKLRPGPVADDGGGISVWNPLKRRPNRNMTNIKFHKSEIHTLNYSLMKKACVYILSCTRMVMSPWKSTQTLTREREKGGVSDVVPSSGRCLFWGRNHLILSCSSKDRKAKVGQRKISNIFPGFTLV